MRYLSSFLLCQLGNNPDPKANDLKKVLGAAQIDADDDKIEQVLSAFQGKSLSEIILQGETMLSALQMSPAPSSAIPTLAAIDLPAETKEEPKEESDDDMGFGLFD
ncbi:unnamed protein product [Caenorhabditis brenneri]